VPCLHPYDRVGAHEWADLPDGVDHDVLLADGDDSIVPGMCAYWLEFLGFNDSEGNGQCNVVRARSTNPRHPVCHCGNQIPHFQERICQCRRNERHETIVGEEFQSAGVKREQR
jgi:hypothetical protein